MHVQNPPQPHAESAAPATVKLVEARPVKQIEAAMTTILLTWPSVRNETVIASDLLELENGRLIAAGPLCAVQEQIVCSVQLFDLWFTDIDLSLIHI